MILQQSEVLHWQAEGAGSMEEVRSVCSCTCNSCVPFQQVNTRSHYGGEEEVLDGARRKGGGDRRRRRRRRRWWMSRDSASWASEEEFSMTGLRADTPMTTLDDDGDDGGGGGHKKSASASAIALGFRRNKADSVHDLRRSAVSSVLRLPPSTPPGAGGGRHSRMRDDRGRGRHSRPVSRAKSLNNALAPGDTRGVRRHNRRGANNNNGDDDFAAIFGVGGRRGRRFSRQLDFSASSHFSRPPPPAPSLLDRLLRWPPQLIAVTPTYSDDDDEVEQRDCYALDEVDAFKVVPVEKNVNRHKRVSL